MNKFLITLTKASNTIGFINNIILKTFSSLCIFIIHNSINNKNILIKNFQISFFFISFAH